MFPFLSFQIRILINQAHQRQIDVKVDLHALRLASFNQILDPWIYILFRKELFVRTFDCLRKIISGRCKSICGCKDNYNEEYAISVARSETIAKPREIPCVKYEYDNAEIARDTNGNCDQNETTGNENGNEAGNRDTCGGSHAFQIRRASRLTANVSGADEETMPLRELPGPKLHLKHSACLFCLSNHPRCVTLLSRSMDGINLLNDKSQCTESNSNTLTVCNIPSKLSRDSIHRSLRDMSRRAEECLTAGNSENSCQCFHA